MHIEAQRLGTEEQQPVSQAHPTPCDVLVTMWGGRAVPALPVWPGTLLEAALTGAYDSGLGPFYSLFDFTSLRLTHLKQITALLGFICLPPLKGGTNTSEGCGKA